jgi:hypothetical protein
MTESRVAASSGLGETATYDCQAVRDELLAGTIPLILAELARPKGVPAKYTMRTIGRWADCPNCCPPRPPEQTAEFSRRKADRCA